MSRVPALGGERFQRLVIAAAAAANRASAILMGTAMAVYVGRIGTPFQVGLVFTVFWLGLMVFSPILGAIADVTGRRRAVLVLTGALATASILPLAVVDGVWGPLLLRGLFAVFAAGFLPVMLTVVSERGGARGRGKSIGFFNSARGVGFTAGQFFAGLLLGLIAPWSLYLITAAISSVVVLAGLVIEDPTPDAEAESSLAEIAAEVKSRVFPATADREHLHTNGLGWLYVAVLLRNTTVLGISSLLPVYLVSAIGVSEFVMGALLALNPAGQILFMYLFGYVSDATGRKPLILYGMAGAVLYGVTMAGAVLPGPLAWRAVVAGVALVLLAVAFSAETTGTYAFIGDIAPHERESELMGLHSTARGFGGMIGPVILGIVATVTTYQVAFAVGSVLALVATGVVALQLVESHPSTGSIAGAVLED